MTAYLGMLGICAESDPEVQLLLVFAGMRQSLCSMHTSPVQAMCGVMESHSGRCTPSGISPMARWRVLRWVMLAVTVYVVTVATLQGYRGNAIAIADV